VRLGRLVAALLTAGLALLVAAIALSGVPANAATEVDRGAVPYHYTQHPARASTGRTLMLYVDRDFDEGERQRIVSAMRQWNYVLNGFLQFRAVLLPDDPSAAELAQIRRNGGWIVARVDSRHPIARQGEGRHALAVTVGSRGGFVYVVGDRIGSRDLSGVVMHEFGHVLGAGHSHTGLMGPVYNPANGYCIDRDAASLVAQAQRLPLQQLNWCVVPGSEGAPGGPAGLSVRR
jgi:Matrixin